MSNECKKHLKQANKRHLTKRGNIAIYCYMATILQEKTGKIIKKNPNMPINKAMRQAGYSLQSSKNGTAINSVRNSKPVQEALAYHSQQLDKIIKNSYKYAQQKQKKATFRDNIEAINSLHKTKLLIESRTVENVSKLVEEGVSDVILERIERIRLRGGGIPSERG